MVAGYFRFQKRRSLRRPKVFVIKGINGAQVDGHGIGLALIGDEHLVLIAGELPELVDILPHLRK